MKNLKILAAALLLPCAAIAADDTLPKNPRSNAPESLGEAMDLGMRYGQVLVDRLEAAYSDSPDSYAWDMRAWWGGDFNRLWFRTEGEGSQGKPLESGEIQALFSRNVAAFWDLQAGIRHDFRPTPGKSHAVVSIQGLAPYRFEVLAAAFAREDGLVSMRAELEYELMFTQRLVLSPRIELNAAAETDRETGTFSGVNSTEAGLRLRYEIRREFAPYVGFNWTQRYGGAAVNSRASGEASSINAVVVGLRTWF